MSEDDRPRTPDADPPPSPDVPAPWERRWAPVGGPDAGAAGNGAEDSGPAARRSWREAGPDDQVSVAELISRADGGTTQRRHRRRTDDFDDTAVLPRIEAEHAPLGGHAPSPPPVRPTTPRPAVSPVPSVPTRHHRPATSGATTQDPVTDGGTPSTGATPVRTRLQDKKTRRQRRAARVGRVTVALVAVLVFFLTGAAWAGLRYVDIPRVQALDPNSSAIQQADQQRGDENFLLIGSDTRAGSNGEIGAGTVSEAAGARSDTTMIAHIPADRSRVVIVSFPRDLDVNLPECRRWNNDTATYPGEQLPAVEGVKLNEAYFEGGPQCITKVVQQLSGLSINHFLGIDFTGFQSMVDALGGVEVCTERPLDDAKLGLILPVAGTQTINGQQALNYVRARYVDGDPTSDYGRIQRQQRLLSSLLRASLSQDTLLDFGKLRSLVDAVTASTFGDNVGVDQLLTLAQSLEGIDAGRVTFVTAPTTGEANSAGNEVLRQDENSALFRAIREGTPLPGEAAGPTPAATDTPAPTTTPEGSPLTAPTVPVPTVTPLPSDLAVVNAGDATCR